MVTLVRAYLFTVMIRIFLALISFALVTASCDNIKILSATRATTVSDSIYATVTNAMPEVITGERLLDTTINPDIAEFEDRISNFDVDSLVFRISDFQGPAEAALEETYLSLLSINREEVVDPVFVQELVLKEYSDFEKEFIIIFNEAESESIAQTFLEDKALWVQFTSLLQDRPVEFRLKATLYLKVTGEIL